jgi:hypothetical protein
LPPNPDRATVYLMREWALGRGFLPPLFFAVDGRMVTALPIGAYVPLSLEPGAHVFTKFAGTGGGLAPIRVERTDVRVVTLAGATDYVSEVNAFWDSFRQVYDKDKARRTLADADLVKFIHAPATAELFERRMADAERRRRAGATTAPQPPSATTQSSRSQR